MSGETGHQRPAGRTLLNLSSNYTCSSQIYPSGIAVDSSNVVYVVDHGNHRVSVFTSEGQFIKSFGREGEGPGEFDFLFSNNCVQVF